MTTSIIRLKTYLFAPYRGVMGGIIAHAVGASPHPILLYPYGVETQQIAIVTTTPDNVLNPVRGRGTTNCHCYSDTE